MESLDGSTWDVLIAGTGIQQSLLALALSRSGRKILHIDSHEYYGGAEAALNLDDFNAWTERASRSQGPFRNAVVHRRPRSEHDVCLANARCYNLALAPDIIYTRSALLSSLVSSHSHQQIEFKAIGSWYLLDKQDGSDTRLVKIPDSREDIFSAVKLDVRVKGALVRFLRFVIVYEDKPETWNDHQNVAFQDFLKEQFRIPYPAQSPLIALTLSLESSSQVTTAFALPRIANHLRSMGYVRPGFNAVVPSCGGLSDITQVACRAAAVGGATYVLNTAIEDISSGAQPVGNAKVPSLSARLSNGNVVEASHIISTTDQIPARLAAEATNSRPSDTTASSGDNHVSKSISIISSPLTALWSRTSELSPQPAAVLVIMHPTNQSAYDKAETPPIHMIVHSSDTGDCPRDQCVIYASTAGPLDNNSSLLSQTVDDLLAALHEEVTPSVLWSIEYEQVSETPHSQTWKHKDMSNLVSFGTPSLDTIFDETILDSVRTVWHYILGADATGFMQFEDRNQAMD